MRRLVAVFLPMLLLFAAPGLTHAEAAPSQQAQGSSMRQDLSAMQDFNRLHQDEVGLLKVKQEKQHKILFFMGVALLIVLLLTAGFGLSMVFGGRQVFAWHMLFAGISLTLALAHAVTAIIWFYPF